MTESTVCITTHPLGGHDFKYARTAYTLVLNTSVKIVDEKGEMLGIGEKGEILVKGRRSLSDIMGMRGRQKKLLIKKDSYEQVTRVVKAKAAKRLTTNPTSPYPLTTLLIVQSVSPALLPAITCPESAREDMAKLQLTLEL
jgi:hypothetical protein